VSRKKAVGSGKNSISAGCRDAREALWVLVDCPSEFKVLASIVMLEPYASKNFTDTLENFINV